MNYIPNKWSNNILILYFNLLSQIVINVHSQCFNPSGQFGYCISIHDCPSLLSFATKQRLTDYEAEYLRQSQCYNGYGRFPLVCCNYYNNDFYNINNFNGNDFRNFRSQSSSRPPPPPPPPLPQPPLSSSSIRFPPQRNRQHLKSLSSKTTTSKKPSTSSMKNSQCVNPNGQYGYCVSLYECPPLISVAMKKPLSKSDIAFLRQAECYEGFGRPPLVCCNNDIGYYNFNQFNVGDNSNNGGIDQSLANTNPTSNQPPRGRTRSNRNSAKLPKPPQCGADGISQKIYGGTDTSLDEFPWMALLVYTKSGQMSMNCGGTLINDRYVLTAAHCLKESIFNKVGQLKYVRLGEYDVTKKTDCKDSECADPVLQVGIERLIPHENFKDSDMHRHNDIGLVKMERSVLFTDYVRPICLPFTVKSTLPSPGSELTVVGWGRTLNARRASIKQKLTVRATSLDECAEKFRAKMVNVIDKQICAGGVLGEDSCDGDSGGPLMRVYKNSWVIEGIVSFGIRCGFKDWPAVHTRVASYENWIKRNAIG